MTKKLLYIFAALLFSSQFSMAQSSSIATFSQGVDSCIMNAQGYWKYVILTTTNPMPGQSITTYWGDGGSSNSPLLGQTGGGNNSINQSHFYTFPGIYTIIAVLSDTNNTPLDSSELIIDTRCYTILGTTYKRNDANCNYDFGIDDPIYTQQQFEVRKNNIAIDTFIAGLIYAYRIPQPDYTSEYSFHPLNNNGYQQVCPNVSTPYKVRLDTLNNTNNIHDIGFECSSNSSFDLFAYMSGFMRITNNSYLTLSVGNASCVHHNGTLTLNIDPRYSYVTSSLAPATISGQILTWNLSNLSGTNFQNIIVGIHPAVAVTAGDTSCNTLSISPTSGDMNTVNNTFNFCDIIHASMDPNEKKVSPIGDIQAGQLLTYTINFENLGNDTAFNIHILDTLSANLDLATFKVISSSHIYTANLFDYGSSKIVKFDFNNINLEDKDHPNGNKGFVMYQAKAKNNLAAGSEIKNTGHIYFDINPAIVTNTVMSKIPVPNGIKEVSQIDGLKIYPNPANNAITIENAGSFNHAKIINAVGQVIKEVSLKTGANKIDINEMNAGIYYLLINGNDGSRSIKMVKQ